MSDLEATSSRTDGAARLVTASASGRTTLAPKTGPCVHHGGALDAFADVFARMAVATAPVAEQRPATDSGPERTRDREGEPASDGSASEASEATGVEERASASTGEQGLGGENLLDSEAIDSPIEIDTEAIAFTQSDSAGTEEEIAEGVSDEIVVAPITTTSSSEHDSRRYGDADKPDLANQPLGDEGLHQQRGDAETGEEESAAPISGAASGIDTGGEPGDEDHSGRSRRRNRGDRKGITATANPGETSQSTQQAIERTEASVASEATFPDSIVPPATGTQRPSPSAGSNEQINAALVANPASGAATPTRQGGGAPSTPAGPATLTRPVGAISGSPSTISDSKPAPTKDATPSDTTEAVNRAKLIQRVSKAFQHLGPDGGVVRLRLAPAELGTVRIEMRIEARKVNARVVAETEAASAVLREHLGELRTRLESHGMQIESMEVETETSAQDSSNDFQQSAFGRRDQSDGQRHTHRRPVPEVSRSVSSTPGVTADVVTASPSAGVDLQL